jgi:uncharacterized protein with HEPN domain
MQLDARAVLFDILSAADAISAFTAGRSFEYYERDRMLQSACERQLEIIGEAMGRLRTAHPTLFAAITDGGKIIALRNRLIHGYASVDSEIVWDVIEHKLAALRETARALLEEQE